MARNDEMQNAENTRQTNDGQFLAWIEIDENDERVEIVAHITPEPVDSDTYLQLPDEEQIFPLRLIWKAAKNEDGTLQEFQHRSASYEREWDGDSSGLRHITVAVNDADFNDPLQVFQQANIVEVARSPQDERWHCVEEFSQSELRTYKVGDPDDPQYTWEAADLEQAMISLLTFYAEQLRDSTLEQDATAQFDAWRESNYTITEVELPKPLEQRLAELQGLSEEEMNQAYITHDETEAEPEEA